MNFLPDVYVPCEVCHGARYNRETLEVHYKGKTIAEVLDMPIEEAAEFFAAVPPIARHLQDAGRRRPRLRPARPAGADAVRRRGAAGQARRASCRSARPAAPSTSSTSRPPACTSRTSASCSACSRAWSTRATRCIVIEHNLDVIKTADWVIDMGPEGGTGGGLVVAEGTPEEVADVAEQPHRPVPRPVLEPASHRAAPAPRAGRAREGGRRPRRRRDEARPRSRRRSGRRQGGGGERDKRRRPAPEPAAAPAKNAAASEDGHEGGARRRRRRQEAAAVLLARTTVGSGPQRRDSAQRPCGGPAQAVRRHATADAMTAAHVHGGARDGGRRRAAGRTAGRCRSGRPEAADGWRCGRASSEVRLGRLADRGAAAREMISGAVAGRSLGLGERVRQVESEAR